VGSSLGWGTKIPATELKHGNKRPRVSQQRPNTAKLKKKIEAKPKFMYVYIYILLLCEIYLNKFKN
jgi:hypothetical protein